jgi:hypothetical protein
MSTVTEANVRREWRSRGLTLVVGAVLALLMLRMFHGQRTTGDEAALGTATTLHVATLDGERLAACRIEEFPDAWPAGTPTGPEALWLGNSQLHSINQARDGDQTAPYYATVELGWPVRGLSLPNASLQEHLVITHWALERRRPDWVILPLVYDDLREDGLRPDMELLATSGVLEGLRAGETGSRLADELAARLAAVPEAEDAIEERRSLQDRTEAWLEAGLSWAWRLWRDRPSTLVAVHLQLYQLRNRVFGIDPTTKRKMIPVRYDRNMQALDELLACAREREVGVLVYIVPLRWDVEPPYVVDDYRRWKTDVGEIVTAAGAGFVDLDEIVPGDEWGTLGAETIDFMHFQDGGHRRLGAAIADWLAAHRDGA